MTHRNIRLISKTSGIGASSIEQLWYAKTKTDNSTGVPWKYGLFAVMFLITAVRGKHIDGPGDKKDLRVSVWNVLFRYRSGIPSEGTRHKDKPTIR
jgi:hypothetical protein